MRALRRLVFFGAAATGCRSDAHEELESQTETETDTPMPDDEVPCPSRGLDPKAALLVTGDSERVVIVRGDGSTLDLDVHPPGTRIGERYAAFSASPAGIATTSQWSDADGSHLGVSMFELDGARRWAMQWEDANGPTALLVSAVGDVAIGLPEGMVTVRGDEVQTFANLGPLAAPEAGHVPVTTLGEWESREIGWVDLEDGTFTAVPIMGNVNIDDGWMTSAFELYGTRVHISVPDAELREIRVEADRPMQIYSVRGSRMMLLDPYAFEMIARVDLEAGAVIVEPEPLLPPPGYRTLPCGWAALTDGGDVLYPLTDGATVSLHRLTEHGEWSATPVVPLSGVPGGRAVLVGGTYAFTSIVNAGACDSVDDALPEVDGTVVGQSMQLVRPESGMSFAWGELAEHAFYDITEDGQCAVRRSEPGRLMIVDMVTGGVRELDVGTEAFSFVD